MNAEVKEAVVEEKDELDTWFDDVETPEESEEAAAADPAPATEDPDTPAGDKAEAKGDDDDSDSVDDPYAWIGALPEEFRDKAKALKDDHDKIEHGYNSQTGRVRSLQAQLDEERRTRQAQPQPTASPAEPATSVEANPELAEKLKKLNEEYPDLVDLAATVSEDKLGARLAAMEKLIEERVRPLQEQASARQLEVQRMQFEEKCAAILNTKETGVTSQQVFDSEEYAAFLENAPAYLRDIANTSTDPDEAASVLEAFVKDQRIKHLEAQATAPDSKSKERKEKLKQNVAPSSRSASASSDDSAKTYDDWFDHYAET